MERRPPSRPPTRRRAGLDRSANSVRGGTSLSRRRPRWRRLLGFVAALFAVACGVLGGLVAYAALTLPNVDDIGRATGTIKILDRNGKLIAEVGHNQEQRTTVTLDKMAPILRWSTLAAEDRNFYQEGAFDIPRVAKALVVDVILRRPAEGGSTITQQLAKEAFFGAQAEKSPLRKLREALLANEIGSKYTKDQILEKYLNLIYYGENAYGVENASQRYFGKPAASLTLSEASLLAGLPQAPSYLDPLQNPAATWARQHYVLQGLVVLGKATQADVDAIDPLVGGDTTDPAQLAVQQQHQQAILSDLRNGKPIANVGAAPHFVQYVENQLNQLFQADDPSYLDGDLQVTTTLDLDIQARADQAVVAGVHKMAPQNANNGALLMIDSHTGDILAMVGSADYNNTTIAGQFNITTAERRPGSSFKPFVYEEGFRTGAIKPDTPLDDTRAESVALHVTDFDNSTLGQITAARSLLLSRNISTEEAMARIGVDNVIAFAHSLGITTDLQPNVSTAIGSSSVRMIEHAAAYAAFANGGHKVSARGILKVADSSGSVLKDLTQAADEGTVMTRAEAYSITKILRGYARQWRIPFRWDTAGKSGTTDNFVDAWYMTYTPDWVVATWTGHTDDTQTEVGMRTLYGTEEGQDIAAPFVNTLSRPSGFTDPGGSLTDCNVGDNGGTYPSGCPTPTPAPTPLATPTPTPLPTAVATQTPLPTPTVTARPTPCVPPTPPTSARPSSPPTPTPCPP